MIYLIDSYSIKPGQSDLISYQTASELDGTVVHASQRRRVYAGPDEDACGWALDKLGVAEPFITKYLSPSHKKTIAIACDAGDMEVLRDLREKEKAFRLYGIPYCVQVPGGLDPYGLASSINELFGPVCESDALVVRSLAETAMYLVEVSDFSFDQNGNSIAHQRILDAEGKIYKQTGRCRRQTGKLPGVCHWASGEIVNRFGGALIISDNHNGRREDSKSLFSSTAQLKDRENQEFLRALRASIRHHLAKNQPFSLKVPPRVGSAEQLSEGVNKIFGPITNADSGMICSYLPEGESK